MKALARITSLTLCAGIGVALAWWAFVQADTQATDQDTTVDARRVAEVHNRPDPARPHSHDVAECNAADCKDLACASCEHKNSSRHETSQTATLPWNPQQQERQPDRFATQPGGVLANSSLQANDQQLVVQTQAYTGAAENQQQNNSLLYTTPQPVEPAFPQQPPADASGTPGTNWSGPLPPPANFGQQPYGQQPASTLIVRSVSARNQAQFPDAQVIPGEGDDKLEIYVNNRDIRQVLTLLSEQGGVNILPLPGATGEFSFAMNGVTVDQALDGILRSTGLITKREGAFILVGAPSDFQAARQPYDFISTRIYRPDYISAADLELLLTGLVTPNSGIIKATAASAVGIPSDAEQAGGNSLADTDALLVQDYESVLRRIDQIVLEVDRRPLQVAIEAMILSVALEDEVNLGVDFELLRNQGTIRFGLGSPESALSNVSFDNGGLNFAFLDSSLGTFIEALEQIGDTDVIATPRLTVLNKQRAEILIGAQLGYVNTTVTETAATQSVDFLEIGTQLRLRPFISRDGTIRMEVHPELSTGNVRIEGGFTLPDKEVTSVTTNIMVQDGGTIVIGGLMREDLVTNQRQVPYLGSLPWIGALFRSKSESTEKREIVLLVTPRIVHEPDVCAEGEAVACEFHRRQAAVADQMSPLTRDSASRRHFRSAQEAWARGDRATALDQIHWSLQFKAQNRAALDLQADILSNRPLGNHTIPPANPHGQLPSPVPPHGYHGQRTQYTPHPLPNRENIPPGATTPGLDVSPGSAPPGSGPPAPSGVNGQFSPTANRSALAPRFE